RPGDLSLYRVGLVDPAGLDRQHQAARGRLLGEGELAAVYAGVGEVIAGSRQAFLVREGQPEEMDAVSATGAERIAAVADGSIAADHAAEVAAPVRGALLRRLGEAARSRQLVVRGQERTLHRAVLRPG